MTVYLLKEGCEGRHTQSFLSVVTASGSTIAASTVVIMGSSCITVLVRSSHHIVWLVIMGSSCITVLVRSSHHIGDGVPAEGMVWRTSHPIFSQCDHC